MAKKFNLEKLDITPGEEFSEAETEEANIRESLEEITDEIFKENNFSEETYKALSSLVERIETSFSDPRAVKMMLGLVIDIRTMLMKELGSFGRVINKKKLIENIYV